MNDKIFLLNRNFFFSHLEETFMTARTFKHIYFIVERKKINNQNN